MQNLPPLIRPGQNPKEILNASFFNKIINAIKATYLTGDGKDLLISHSPTGTTIHKKRRGGGGNGGSSETVSEIYHFIKEDGKFKMVGSNFSYLDFRGRTIVELFETLEIEVPDAVGVYALGLFFEDEKFVIKYKEYLNEHSCIPLATFEIEENDKNEKVMTKYKNVAPKVLHKMPLIKGSYSFESADSLKLKINEYTISSGPKTFDISEKVFDVNSDAFFVWLEIKFDGSTALKSGSLRPVESETEHFNLMLIEVYSVDISGKQEYMYHLEHLEGWTNYYGAGVWG